MSSYATPARVRFPRSDVTGVVPLSVAPGSLAINWPDRKIYVGDGAGNPVLFTQWLAEWDVTLGYRKDDLAIRDGEIYRATVDIAPNTPFAIGIWQVVTGSGRAKISEPFASSSVGAGGTVTVAPGTTDSVAVTAGTGMVIDVTGALPVERNVTWGDTVIAVPATQVWHVVHVTASGVIAVAPIAALLDARRRNIVPLAYVLPHATGLHIVGAQLQIADTAETLRDMYFADGGNYRASGLRMSVGAGLKLSISAGTLFAMGQTRAVAPDAPNLQQLAARADVPMTYVSRGRVRGTVTALDPTKWDSGAATLATVAPAVSTIQYVYQAPNGTIFVQYGSAVYTSMARAVASLEDDWAATAPYLAGTPLVLLGALLMRGDASLPADVTVITASNRGDPFISTSSGVSDQYMLADGSRPMVGDLDMGDNDINNAVIDGGTF